MTAHPCNTTPKPITSKGNRLEGAVHPRASLFFALTALSKSSQYALYSIAVPTQMSQTSRLTSRQWSQYGEQAGQRASQRHDHPLLACAHTHEPTPFQPLCFGPLASGRRKCPCHHPHLLRYAANPHHRCNRELHRSHSVRQCRTNSTHTCFHQSGWVSTPH